MSKYEIKNVEGKKVGTTELSSPGFYSCWSVDWWWRHFWTYPSFPRTSY